MYYNYLLQFTNCIKIDQEREIINIVFSCKGGDRYCKQPATICICMNEENIRSKSNLQIIWNKPLEI